MKCVCNNVKYYPGKTIREKWGKRKRRWRSETRRFVSRVKWCADMLKSKWSKKCYNMVTIAELNETLYSFILGFIPKFLQIRYMRPCHRLLHIVAMLSRQTNFLFLLFIFGINQKRNSPTSMIAANVPLRTKMEIK